MKILVIQPYPHYINTVGYLRREYLYLFFFSFRLISTGTGAFYVVKVRVRYVLCNWQRSWQRYERSNLILHIYPYYSLLDNAPNYIRSWVRYPTLLPTTWYGIGCKRSPKWTLNHNLMRFGFYFGSLKTPWLRNC